MIELQGKYNTAKVFTDNVDEKAIGQVIEMLNEEFTVGSNIRIMPDTHAGDLIKVTSDSIEFQPLLPAEFISFELVLKEDNMERPVNSPLGIIPKKIWKEQRLGELRDAVERYLEANQRIPIEWIEEYNQLLDDILKES